VGRTEDPLDAGSRIELPRNPPPGIATHNVIAWADEFVETCDRCLAVDGDLLATGPRAVHARRLAGGSEELEDVFGPVREGVARRSTYIGALPFSCDDPCSVAMDQAAKKWFSVCGHDLPLPVREDNRPSVLPSRAVLRNEADPVLPVSRNDDRSAVTSPLDAYLASANGFYGTRAFGDYARIERSINLPLRTHVHSVDNRTDGRFA
jgi:hypothetical protein